MSRGVESRVLRLYEPNRRAPDVPRVPRPAPTRVVQSPLATRERCASPSHPSSPPHRLSHPPLADRTTSPGLSWDVLKPLALTYDLHPLSLEDVVHHGSSSTRSKADYYREHLFASVLVHRTFAASAEEDDLGVFGRAGKDSRAAAVAQAQAAHARQTDLHEQCVGSLFSDSPPLPPASPSPFLLPYSLV